MKSLNAPSVSSNGQTESQYFMVVRKMAIMWQKKEKKTKILQHLVFFFHQGCIQKKKTTWSMGCVCWGGHHQHIETLSLVWNLVAWGEWIQHHNAQAKYLSSPYSESIMKSFYRGHHWNLSTDFMPENRFHWALLFPLRLTRSPVAQSKFNTEPCVQNKNELWLCLTDGTQ